MSDIRFEVKKYIDEGFGKPHPISPGTKAPRDRDWQTPDRTFGPEDFHADDNVGTALTDGLVDIDLDHEASVALAPAFLPPTERVQGRKSKPLSHYYYRIADCKHFVFKDIPRPDPDNVGKVKTKNLLELRTGITDQTMIPPSVWVDKVDPTWRELVEWAKRDAPGTPTKAVLWEALRALATASLLALQWPSGNRHKTACDFAGFMAARDRPEAECLLIVQEAMRYAHDEEPDDRLRAVKDTYKAFRAGSKTSGGPSMEAALGADTVKRFTDWWGGNSSIHDGIIKEMNETLFVVSVGKDEVIGQEDEQDVVFKNERAMQLRYANQKVKVGEKRKKVKDGEIAGQAEPVFDNKFSLWRQHPLRREYRRVAFAPPPYPADPRDYNLWKGLAVRPLIPEVGDAARQSPESMRAWADEFCRPKCERYLDLVYRVICGGEPQRQDEYYAYLIDLMAFTIQQPGIPCEVAVVLKGDRGIGKTVFVKNFGKIFGRHFATVVKPEQIVGKFNASISGKIVLFAEEAFYAGDKRDLGALKVLITDDVLRIERKGIDPIEEPNFTHLFMASNEGWHTPVGFQERRFLALSVSDIHRQDYKYFDAITAEMTNGGREALASYLLTRDITPERRRELRQAPRTAELGRQLELSLPPELRWWMLKLRSGVIDAAWPDRVAVGALHTDYLGWCDEMNINRRIDDWRLASEVLAPFLGRKIRARTANGERPWQRELLPLGECREKMDQITGVKTEWDDVEEEADEPGPPDDNRPLTDDIPF